MKKQQVDVRKEGVSHVDCNRISLCTASGILLGLSFPPISISVFACFGLVPFLIALKDVERYAPAIRYGYVTFLIFHVITLSWVGGYSHMNDAYMMVAGGIVVFIHPMLFVLPVLGYVLVKRALGEKAALLAFPFIWVGYEYSRSLTEWSFPWLTLGLSQSNDIERIQFSSTTGIYGLSFWIIVVNVVAYSLYKGLTTTRTTWSRNVGYAVTLAFVYLLPRVHGEFVLAGIPQRDASPISDKRKTITVGMVQSNVDPWQKWKLRGSEAMDVYLRLTTELIRHNANEKPEIILWPETAIPGFLLSSSDDQPMKRLHEYVNRNGVSILTGLPQVLIYHDSSVAPPSAKRLPSGTRYDQFNAAAFIQREEKDVAWYGKMKLVPFAERVPYADSFHFLGFLQWDVGIGGWQIGRERTVFQDERTGTRFSTLICYESSYPEFVASFVREGAEFLGIITIDSWWGRMSGAYQHKQHAVFRAVENRRWIARCAVGGISAFIDPHGRTYDETELFTTALLNRSIDRDNELTFYSRYGDLFSKCCSATAGVCLILSGGRNFVAS
ncbi:MAG: apolipoprotein N-acyltransferase [Ignavibacteriae bacterium]|nr:apolipoprotein N-acyltransferase [Ignavibacteriota bacterium]